ncbi:hypothetical protein [Rhodomicrobium vannielii]|uniref:hypothetical protein n=1 Tax=Rhodomicrobium vannielii TaxID=1069 RepID=UPI0001C26198|nr:hypothetical protein [Rhodomicrobium vannielii]
MARLLTSLSDWGVPGEDIHHEAFGPDYVRSNHGAAKEAVPRRSGPFEVNFHRSGRTVVWDGQDTNLLDFAERHGNHNPACVTCHAKNDYKRYTCYGCHEHRPDDMRAKHLHEGIRDFENCVRCHRSGREGEDDD